MMTLDEIYEIARKDLELYDFECEYLDIEITFIWKPYDDDHYEWTYDEEYSFRGTQSDYQKWKEDYFEFLDIDENYVSYRPKNKTVLGHPDVSILYFRDY